MVPIEAVLIPCRNDTITLNSSVDNHTFKLVKNIAVLFGGLCKLNCNFSALLFFFFIYFCLLVGTAKVCVDV